MLKKAITFLLTVSFLAGALLAHGNATHLMGTVTAVSKDTVTIQDKGGKSVVVMLEKAAKYFKTKKPGAIDELKIGTRGVIAAQMTEKMNMTSAEAIQVGA